MTAKLKIFVTFFSGTTNHRFLKFGFKDFEKGKFEEDRQKARSERETIKHSEYVPIEDVKAEIMMTGPGNMTFTPVRADDSDSVSEEENFEMVEFKEVVFKDYELKDDEVMDFDKLFERMENPDDFSTSEEEDVAMETETKVIEGKGFESLMEIQEDIDQNSSKSAKTDLTIEEDEVFDEKEESGKNYLSEIRRKSVDRSSLSSTSSQDMSSKEKRERFKRKRSRDPSMQAFLDSVERETSEKGKAVLKSTRSTSQDKSFDLEMPVLEYLKIVDTKDKEEKRKILEDMKQRYPSVQEEEKEETSRESEDTEQKKGYHDNWKKTSVTTFKIRRSVPSKIQQRC
ncbi:coiled-coil domain-containing protein 43 homolog [Mytilus edulis]|uniref:coiled-coil domain-containing protein 43 homolog n=1 Tax=Mytilus edulis TaxID=6550 RepID=UPI0039EEC71B